MQSYRNILDSLLDKGQGSISLFEFHQFYLLGFETDETLKVSLSKVIRNGGGTIHWELSSDVTLLVVHDTCHESLRKASQFVSSHHPNLPPLVSPLWIIDSARKNTLVPTTKYPPVKNQHDSAQHATSKVSSKPMLTRSNSMPPSVLRGLLFALSRVAPPTGSLDFDSKDQENLIRRHGGQLLSLKLMDAMKTDSKINGQRRKCYVVCWGGAPRLELNPFLSQLKRYDICDMVLVTPVWLKICISLQKLVPPSVLSEVLVPSPWPLKMMEANELRVSLTGFSAIEKMALVTLMDGCRVSFSNEMTSNCTHLICKEKAEGLKLQKALEWGLHIVSVDWLYYILQYGYKGDESTGEACEIRFAVNLTDVEK